MKKLSEKSIMTDLCDMWLSKKEQLDLEANTLDGYKVNAKNHIIPNIGNERIKDVTANDLVELYDKLRKKGLNSTTILYVHHNLYNMFKYAVRERVITINPCSELLPEEIPKKAKFKGNAVDLNTICKMIEKLAEYESGLIFIPIATCVCCGLRESESLSLRFEEIDDDGVLRLDSQIKKDKSGKYIDGSLKDKELSDYRLLQLPEFILKKVFDEKVRRMKLLNINNDVAYSQYIVCNEFGTFRKRQWLYKHFKRFLKAYGFDDISVHDLRRSYATVSYKNNVPIEDIMISMGHTSDKVTKQYIIDDKKPTDLLSNLFNELDLCQCRQLCFVA